MEVGRGSIAVQGRYSKFYEEQPQDDMVYAQLHLMRRLSYTEGLGINLGAGVATLRGNEQNSGFSLTMPVLIHLTRNIGVEFRPTVSWLNGNAVTESDSMLMLSHKSFSLIAGYRSLAAGDALLSGAYAGISLRH